VSFSLALVLCFGLESTQALQATTKRKRRDNLTFIMFLSGLRKIVFEKGVFYLDLIYFPEKFKKHLF
jgi:hypothetical protein